MEKIKLDSTNVNRRIMKRTLTILFALLSLTAFGQIPEKGLIFHAKLGEWNTQPGAQLTSGTITSGKVYTIGNYVSNDDFTNVGASSNASGVTFLATGTTPTHWAHSSILRQQNYYTTDLISGTKGVNTDVYNVLGSGGEGRRSLVFDGVNDVASLADADRFDNGLNDFSVTMTVNPYKTAHEMGIMGKYLYGSGGGGYNIQINDGYLYCILFNSDFTKMILSKSNILIPLNTETKVATVISRADNTIKLYLNGVESTYTTYSSVTGGFTTTDDLTNAQPLKIGYGIGLNTTPYFQGEIGMVRMFNFALTATQAVNYMKPEYPVEYVHQGATGASLITGDNSTFTSDTGWWTRQSGWTIADGVAHLDKTGISYMYRNPLTTVSKYYRITYTVLNYVSGTVKIEMSTSATPVKSANGTYTSDLLSTGTGIFYFVPGSGVNKYDIDDVTCTQLGCLLDLNAEGINYATGIWQDRTNSLSATVSGATVSIPPSSELGAMRFNGSTSKIDYTAGADLGNVYTFSVWANINQTITTSSGIALLIYPKTDNYVGWLGAVSGSITNELITIGNGATTAYSYYAAAGGSISIGWHHYAFVWTGSKYQIYLDGVALTTATNSTPSLISATEIYIGWTFTNGCLDDARFYSRSLSAEEVLLMYQSGH